MTGNAPVLFLIFINDMQLHLQTDTDIYADIITHTAGKKLEVIEPRLQNQIKSNQIK